MFEKQAGGYSSDGIIYSSVNGNDGNDINSIGRKGAIPCANLADFKREYANYGREKYGNILSYRFSNFLTKLERMDI